MSIVISSVEIDRFCDMVDTKVSAYLQSLTDLRKEPARIPDLLRVSQLKSDFWSLLISVTDSKYIRIAKFVNLATDGARSLRTVQPIFLLLSQDIGRLEKAQVDG